MTMEKDIKEFINALKEFLEDMEKEYEDDE